MTDRSTIVYMYAACMKLLRFEKCWCLSSSTPFSAERPIEYICICSAITQESSDRIPRLTSKQCTRWPRYWKCHISSRNHRFLRICIFWQRNRIPTSWRCVCTYVRARMPLRVYAHACANIHTIEDHNLSIIIYRTPWNLALETNYGDCYCTIKVANYVAELTIIFA